MWRYPFFNLCFVVLVMGLLAVQHSATVFAPTPPWDEGRETAQRYSWQDEAVSRAGALAKLGQAETFLSDTWHRGMVLKQWLLEYNTSQWEFFRSSSPVENDLLEARFHVANAEVFTEVVRESDRAIRELDRAEKSLEAARTVVEANLISQLSTVQEEMKAAEAHEQDGDALSAASFETIKADLDHLIEIVRVSNA